jgi:histone deacetylase complex subunit SAP18
LRVFYNVQGRHIHASDYSRGVLPPDELHIHTWMDATLKELSTLIREMLPEARRPGTRMDFEILFPEQFVRGYRSRHMGALFIGQKSNEELKTLEEMRFQVGDLVDVAISGPHVPAGLNRGGPRVDRDRDRENKRR